MSAPKLQPTDYSDFESLVRRVTALENSARQAAVAVDIASYTTEPAAPSDGAVRLYVHNGTLKAVNAVGTRTTIF